MRTFHADSDFRRLDLAVSTFLGISRSRASELIRRGGVILNGKPVLKPSVRLARGSVVVIDNDILNSILAGEFDDSSLTLRPRTSEGRLPFSVLYRDEHLLVINKSAPLVVHPAPGHLEDTLLNYLAGLFPEILRNFGEKNLRSGVVHRLDMETSGLMMVALNESARLSLSNMIAERNFTRRYVAIVSGVIGEESFCVEGFMGRSRRDRKKMTLYSREEEGTRWSKTCFRVLSISRQGPRGYSLVEASLFTGRTHQVRVHLSHRGFPVVGDAKYGGKDKLWLSVAGENRIALHAYFLSFEHPVNGKLLEFRSNPPDYFRRFLSRVGLQMIL